MALNNLGIALQQADRHGEAITACQGAAAMFRETGDRHGKGMALANLGLALRQVRRYEEDITAHRQDPAICRETRDRHGEGIALNNLGVAISLAGRRGRLLTGGHGELALEVVPLVPECCLCRASALGAVAREAQQLAAKQVTIYLVSSGLAIELHSLTSTSSSTWPAKIRPAEPAGPHILRHATGVRARRELPATVGSATCMRQSRSAEP